MAMPWLRHRLTPATPRTSTKATLYMRSIRKNYSLPVPRLATLVRCTTSSYSTFFEVLGVSESASLEEVKAAFRAKSKLLHPDVNNSLTAARDFMLLRRAYKTLSTHELRTQYEAKLGMPSARAHDPRFARFERWRCEVIPDLRIQLDVWSRSLDGYLTAWRASVAERERSLGRLYSACLDSLRQLHQLQQETHPTTQDYVYQYPPLPQQQQRPPDARLCPEPDPLSRASAASGDFFVAPPGNFNINGSGSGWSSEFPVLLECVEGMFQQMAAEVAGIAADSGDGTARVDREVEKRYQQVSMRYPAYPDIVWMDVWEETAELWKAQGAAEAERCAESGKIWSERLQQLKGRLHAMAPAEVIIQSSREQAAATKAAEARAEEGADVTLLLSLPKGEQAAHKFKTGVTVAYVKAFVAEQHKLEFSKIKLLLGGRLMIDPLSLSDCPGISPGQEVAIEVSIG